MNERYAQLIEQIGKAGLNALFPKDFELYALTLELVNHRNETIDYLTFHVLPSEISYDDMSLTNIKKTLGGVSVIKNSSFVPKTINISGTFGKSLKLLINNINLTPKLINLSEKYGVFDGMSGSALKIRVPVFDTRLKTGYGAIQLLKSILLKSRGSDGENPYKLFMYNPIIGENFVVEYDNIKINQSIRSNTIYNYEVKFKAVSRIENSLVDKAKQITKQASLSVLRKGASILSNEARKII